MTTKKPIGIIVAAFIVVGFVAGYFLMRARERVPSNAPGITRNNMPFPVAPNIRSLAGLIGEVNGMTFTLDVASSVANPPFVKGFPAVRTVIVTSSTKVSKLSMESPANFQKDMNIYEGRLTTNGVASAGSPPTPFFQTNIPFLDVKEGDMVIVLAGNNIASATSFVATAIRDDSLFQAVQASSTPPRTVSTSSARSRP